MPGALSARGLSTDPQCHLPHRLGEARWVLVLCSCLVALMDQSVNTLGFWPVWRPILSSDSVKWPQAWSRCLAELMLSGLGLIFLTRIFYSATHPIFFSSALRSSTCRVSRVGPDLVYKLTLVCFSFTWRLWYHSLSSLKRPCCARVIHTLYSSLSCIQGTRRSVTYTITFLGLMEGYLYFGGVS